MRLDPNDPRLVTGAPEQHQQARAEWLRQQRIEIARKSEMQEVNPDDLEFGCTPRSIGRGRENGDAGDGPPQAGPRGRRGFASRSTSKPRKVSRQW